MTLPAMAEPAGPAGNGYQGYGRASATCAGVDCTVQVEDPQTVPGHTGSSTPTAGPACRPPSGPGVPAGLDCAGCLWQPVSSGDQLPPGEATAAQRSWTDWSVICYAPGGAPASARTVLLPPGPPPMVGVPAAQLAVQAGARFHLPAPALHTNPAGQTYVHLQTFLWLDPAQWRPVSARATDGVKTVSATATPTGVTWALGEGTVVCAGPGHPFDPHGPEAQTTDCGYVYARPSVDQPGAGNDRAYPIRATLSFRVHWTCQGPCDQAAGDLAARQTSAAGRLRVAEVQTVVQPR